MSEFNKDFDLDDTLPEELAGFDADLTDEELEDQDEDFVDLAPLYVQDVDNVGEVRV